jgi:hypothetical protein
MAVLGRILKGGIKVTSVLQRRKAKPLKQQKQTFIKLLSKAAFTQFSNLWQGKGIL